MLEIVGHSCICTIPARCLPDSRLTWHQNIDLISSCLKPFGDAMHSYCVISKHNRMVRRTTVFMLCATMVFSIVAIAFSTRTLTEMSFTAIIIGSRGLITGASVMLSVGAFALVTTPIGLYSATGVYPSLTLTYMTLALFMCLLSLVGGWYGLHLISEIDSGVILRWMNYSLLAEYGNPVADHLTQSWDELHEKYSCCGVTAERSTVEWLDSLWFIMYDRWPRPRVPASCCMECEAKGCYEPLLADLRYYSTGTILFSSIMAFICLLDACLCFFIHESSFSSQIFDEALLP